MIGAAHAFVVNRPLAALFALLALSVPLLVARTFVTLRPQASDTPAQRRRRGLGGW